MPRNLTQQEKDLACLLLQLHEPAHLNVSDCYVIYIDGQVNYKRNRGSQKVVANAIEPSAGRRHVPSECLPSNTSHIGYWHCIIVRDLPAAWQAHYAIRQYLTGEAPPTTPAPMPHTLPIEQTLLYAIMTQAKGIPPAIALEMIADARADSLSTAPGNDDRQSALCCILDRTGTLIDGVFARVLGEIGPLVP